MARALEFLHEALGELGHDELTVALENEMIAGRWQREQQALTIAQLSADNAELRRRLAAAEARAPAPGHVPGRGRGRTRLAVRLLDLRAAPESR